MHSRSWVAIATALLMMALAICLCGCGGGSLGSLDSANPDIPDPGSAGGVGAGKEIPGLPSVPSGSADQGGLRTVSEKDNIQLGFEDWDHSVPGADYNETNMILYGPSSEYGAWAIYQWSGFTSGLIPNSVTVDSTLDPGREYWMLLANYSFSRWQLVGPIKTETFTYNFDLGFDFVSPGACVYVALLADKTNAALIKKLNLRADRDIDPPTPPQNLRAEDITGHQANILWDKNTEPGVMGYRLYRGPDAGFDPQDFDAELVEEFTFLEDQYLATGLLSETTYYYRLTAFDTAMNESRGSELLEFTTLPNTAPVADFSFSPSFVQVDRDVTFDPTASTDAGDDISHDLFKWDFENDGTIDLQTTGPEIVTHQYSQRRTFHCRLIVSDGQLEDDMVKDIQVSFRYDYHIYGDANGLGGLLNSVATDPATGRIAVSAVTTPDGNGIYYYHDGAWEWIPLDLPDGHAPIGVCLGLDCVSLLTVQEGQSWHVLEYNGSGWSEVWTGGGAASSIISAAIGVSADGKYCVATVSANEPPPGQPAQFFLRLSHHDNGLVYDQQFLPDGAIYPYAVARDEDASYCAFVMGDVSVIKIDNTQTISSEQAGGPADSIGLFSVPGSPGDVCWVVGEQDGDILWGDNFGAANAGDQTLASPEPAINICGMKSAGDNEAEFYWIGEDSNHVNYLRGFDSLGNAGAGEQYDIAQGYGLAIFGGGGALDDNGDSGIYFAVQEDRDGELTGYYYDHGIQLRKEEIYGPSGSSPVLGYSWPIIFPDDSLSVLCQQPFPTAIRVSAPTLSDTGTLDVCGDDNFVIPAAACPTGNGNEFLVASPSSRGDVVVTRFDAGAVTGEEILAVGGARQPVLKRNPLSGKVMLAYSKNQSFDIYSREWDGASWTPEALAYSGAVTIMQVTLQARNDAGWGLGIGLDNDTLWLVESDGTTWGSASQISGQLLNDYCGVALGYNSVGDCAVAIERGSPQELWMGLRKFGEAGFNFELVDPTTEGEIRGMSLFFEGSSANPVIFYFKHVQFTEESGIYVMENIDDDWTQAHFDFVYFESPLGTAVDSNGNIVISGVYGWPAQAVYSVIWR